MKNVVTINPKDNVCVTLTGSGNVPAGHKIATSRIEKGERVIKYGEPIGVATKTIEKGEWVHTHNVKSALDESTSLAFDCPKYPVNPSGEGTFLGYERKSGEAGIRNDIFIIPTVGCVNGVCRKIAAMSQRFVRGSINGIFALTHQFGCSQLGDDAENIAKLLCSIALNPNASKVLIVGLGCENNGIAGIKKRLASYNRDNIEFLNCQDAGDEVSDGLAIIEKFADEAQRYKRKQLPLTKLRVGLKCGGSDGFSGLTANPLVGRFTDRLVSLGGSAVLTEIPETFGAEKVIGAKCASKAVFDAYAAVVGEYKKSYSDAGYPVYENPSPGNKAGGITTLEEKSLGCVEKAGSTAITDVIGYGERASADGVTVLAAPGNDLIAATALGAAGCQIILFTTGRGTPFSAFVPTLKISSNARLAERKNNWIDFDASSMDEDGLWNKTFAVINGEERCKSEYDREIAFYKKGVTL